MSDRQKLFYALLASAFFHLALGLVLASWTARHTGDVVKALPDLTQLVVTIMPPKPDTAAPPPPPAAAAAVPTPPPASMMRPELDSDGLTKSEKAPAHALFQSDANMAAGSELPGAGKLPLPTIAGPKRNFTDFADRASSIGKGQSAAAAAAHPARPAIPAAPAMPVQTPAAVTRVEKSAVAQSTPAPPAPPAPAPKPVPTPAPDTLALGKPTPTPAAQLPTPVEQLARLSLSPTLRASADIAPMTRPPTSPAPPVQAQPPAAMPAEPDTLREMDRTRVEGGINVPGPAGVDAIETPFGRYHRKLSNLIGSRWKLYLREHPADVGEVTILFTLAPSGRVVATRVIDNHASDDLADISTRAILESNLPPVPGDLAPMLRNGRLEVSFTFNIYDPNQ